jgi:hypothetical protein
VGRGDLAGPTIAGLVWRHQAKAGMAAIRIMSIEEASAKRLGGFDAAAPLRACPVWKGWRRRRGEPARYLAPALEWVQ